MKNLNLIFQKIYSESFLNAKNIRELNKCLIKTCSFHEIKYFAIAQITKNIENKKEGFFAYSTYPALWLKRYTEKKYYEIDPLFTKPIHSLFPFFWDENSFNNLSEIESNLFLEAKTFGIKSGTTIPLTPEDNKNSYLTLLDFDLTDKFHSTFWLRTAGDAYLKKQEELKIKKI